MNEHRNRQLNALLGVFLVVVAAGVVVLLGDNLTTDPVVAGQVTLLGLAGVCDIVAAIDGRLAGGWAWYRWSGLGNVFLGLSLPLGFVGSSDELVFFVVAGVGGLSLAAIGVDLLAFHGEYTRDEQLGHQT